MKGTMAEMVAILAAVEATSEITLDREDFKNTMLAMTSLHDVPILFLTRLGLLCQPRVRRGPPRIQRPLSQRRS
jgi:hypothetical protein